MLGLGDHALGQHLVQHILLPPLVPLLGIPHLALLVLHPGQGIGAVAGGVVGDGNEAGALGQVQLGHGLAEIGVGGGTHPLAPAAQGNDVEVPGDGVLFRVVLGEAQGTDDLGDLALDGGLVIAGEVFDELLGDGGAAGDVPAGEHVQHGLGRALPVHAGVGPEPLVLDGHGGVDEILGDVVIVHPDGAGVAEEGDQLLVLPGVRVGVIHHAVLPQGEVVQAQVGHGEDHRFDIYGGKAAQDGPCAQEYQQQSAQDKGQPSVFPARPAGAAPPRRGPAVFVGVLRLPAGMAAGGIVAVFIKRAVGMILI